MRPVAHSPTRALTQRTGVCPLSAPLQRGPGEPYGPRRIGLSPAPAGRTFRRQATGGRGFRARPGRLPASGARRRGTAPPARAFARRLRPRAAPRLPATPGPAPAPARPGAAPPIAPAPTDAPRAHPAPPWPHEPAPAVRHSPRRGPPAPPAPAVRPPPVVPARAAPPAPEPG